MTIDEKVEQILPKIDHIPEHFWRVYENQFGKDDDGQGDNIEHLYRYMRDKRLIEPGSKDEEYIVLTTFGYDVVTKHGGWLNFIKTNSLGNPLVSVRVVGTEQKLEIKDSVIHGDAIQSSDSSQKKIVKKATKQETSMIKKVVISVIGGLILALILYYVFGINP